jgi:capsular polysaccharide biosynthesis protein
VISVSERGAQSIAIEISVTTGDPEESAIIANELFNVIDQLTRSNEIENLETVDGWGLAEAPENPSGPNRLLYMIIGVILGGILGVFAVFMIEFLDKSVKSTNEIENKIGLRVLGIIPDYDMEVEGDE